MASSPGSTLRGLRAYAKSAGVRLYELAAAGGTAAICPEWGGRIVFLGTGEANALWTSPDFSRNSLWPANYGGCRAWFGPEDGPKSIFCAADRATSEVPPKLDPGHFRVIGESGETSAQGIVVENGIETVSKDGTAYRLRTMHEVFLAPAPGPAAGARCLAVRFAHTWRNLSDRAVRKEIALWHLAQVIPGGTVLVPVNGGAGDAYRDYFGAPPPDCVAVRSGCVSAKIDGARYYKLGVSAERAADSLGTIAYARAIGGEASLLAKRFTVDRKGVYVDRPPRAEGNGDPIQIYNHRTGGPEGFGEIECHAPAIEVPPGGEQRFEIEIVLFEGAVESVLAAGGKCLGRDLGKAKLFEF